MKRLVCVLIAMLALAGPSAAVPPLLSNLTLLPGDGTIGPAAGLQESPAIAAGGPGFLAVWTDARSAITPLVSFSGGPFGTPGIGTMRDIYAARLDPAGNVIDTTPIAITTATLNQGGPQVAWNGSAWLVVWQHQRGIGCCPKVDIMAARLSPAGTLLDLTPIVVDTAETMDGLHWPAVASDGTNWVVVWRDLDEDAGIFTVDGARISPSGAVLDPGGVRLRRDSWNSYPVNPHLAFAGDEFLLVWVENTIENSWLVRGQRLTPGLGKLGGVFTINLDPTSTAACPSVASDGSDYLVAWFEARYFAFTQCYAARVTHDGSVLDASGIAITDYANYTQFTPAVAWDGANWVVAFNSARPAGSFDENLYASRITPAGTVIDPNGVLVMGGAGMQSTPAIAAGGGGTQIIWTDTRAGGSIPQDIYAAPFTSTGVPGSETSVALGAPRQRMPDFVRTPSAYLAVFLSEVSGSGRVVGQRFDLGGNALDLEPFAISPSGPGITSPSVAWDGTRFLVAWSDAAQSVVYARRLSADATPLDPDPLQVMPGDNPDVAALGDAFLVVATYAQNPHFRYPYSVRVRGSDGARLDGTPRLIGSYFATHVSVARLGDRWLAAWQQNPTHDNPHANIWANFVEQTGVPGTSFPLTAYTIPSAEDPSVAAAGDTAVVLWTDNLGASWDVRGRRVLATGTRLDPSPFLVSGATGDQIRPAANWDGQEFIAGFADFRNDPHAAQPVGDVFAARLTEQGQLLDPSGFAVFDSPTPIMEIDPAVAGASGTAALGGTVFRAESPFAAYRVAYRIKTDGATLGVGDPGTPVAAITVTPNPSSGHVEMAFTVQAGVRTTATLYDLLGREVRRIFDGHARSDRLVLRWDGRDTAGATLSPGAYFLSLRSGTSARIAKIVRL